MAPEDSVFSFTYLMDKGGVVMWPLLLCSLLSLTIVIERLIWGPKQARVIPQVILEQVLELVSRRRIEEALGLCRANKSPLARVLIAVLSNAQASKEEITQAAEQVGKRVAWELQRYLTVLGTIAAVSPLLGLLGTVFGMIKTFTAIQAVGVGNAGALAGGISEALITTAAGLTIAIPSLVFYRYFLHATKRCLSELEDSASRIMFAVENAQKTIPQVPQRENVR